jgi:hypothetical protein
MNPSSNTQPAQLTGHFAHAGGWSKLGWQNEDMDRSPYALDDQADQDDTEHRLLS